MASAGSAFPTLSLLFAIALSACAAAPSPEADVTIVDLAIVGVTVIDVAAAVRVPDRTVLIAGERIVEVGAAGEVPVAAGVETVDGRGLFAVPGLWDMHVHALWDLEVADTVLPLFVAHGVTGIRDMGGTLEVLAAARARRAGGGHPAMPRIVAAGAILDGPEPVDPSISRAIATAEDARAAVAELAAAGVDFLKPYTLLSKKAYLAVVAEGRARGLPVAGHVPGAVTPEEAAALGQRSIEHLRDELGPFCTRAEATRCVPLLETLRRHDVHQVPTLTILRRKAIPGYREDGEAVAGLERMPVKVRREWSVLAERHRRRDPGVIERRRQIYRDELWLVGELRDAGVPIMAGTDALNPYVVPGWSLHDELELLVKAGLEPAAALAAATVVPARFLGREDELGAVREGFLADLVLLGGDPLVEIGSTRLIAGVVIGGRLNP